MGERIFEKLASWLMEGSDEAIIEALDFCFESIKL